MDGSTALAATDRLRGRAPEAARPPARRLLFGIGLAAALSAPAPAAAQDGGGYAYHRPAAELTERGMQALMVCNGLFVSDRSLESVYEQELKLYRTPVLPPGRVHVDSARKAVRVGGGGNDPIPAMRAAWREGLGCVVMAPDQTFEDIDALPVLRAPPAPGDADTIPWPAGDRVEEKPLPDDLDGAALEAAAEWAFDRATHGHPSQVTLSLLVVRDGDILYERYAPGVDRTTRTRTWSTAKSIAATLIGILVDRGELELDAPLPFGGWGPEARAGGGVTAGGREIEAVDPRGAVTMRDALHMSSGLYPVDNELCHVVGSCLSYWAGASSAVGARDRGLVAEPGTVWDYENYDTLLGVLAMKTALGDPQAYLEFPRRALFDRIGMRSTMPGVDRFGDFVMSSQVYTNARDLARLALLHLNRGMWNGERILSEDWVDFVRTPAPATADRGRFYGGQWWLVPDERTDLPQDAYSTAGNRGQHAIVVPSHDLVVVRRGLDWLPGEHGFPWWDLLAEVLKAFPDRPGGEKPAAEHAAAGGAP